MTRLRFTLALALIPLAAALIAAPRFVVDPYGVFRQPEQVVEGFRPNLRFIKHVALSRSCEPGWGYVLGTSRATGYDVAAMERIYGVPFFNYTVPTESWRGLQMRADWLIANCQPAILVMTIDPLTRRMDIYADDYLRLEPPELTGANALGYRLDYLRVPMSAVLRPTVRDDRFAYDPETGHWSIPEVELSRSRGNPLDERNRCAPRRMQTYPKQQHSGQIRVLEQIASAAEAAEAAETPIVWVVNPLSATFLNRFSAEYYRDWTLDFLSAAGELVMLGGYNAYTTNGLNYWEPSHFRIAPTGPFYAQALESRNERLVGVWTAANASRLGPLITESFDEHRRACRRPGP